MIKLPSLKNRLPKSMQDQKGASAIEYAVLVGLVVAILVAVFTTTGSTGLFGALTQAFNNIISALPGGA